MTLINNCYFALGVMLLFDGETVWVWVGWCGNETFGAGSTMARHLAIVGAVGSIGIRYAAEKSATRGPLLVRAGLEPPQFVSLFPRWEVHQEARQVNLQVT